MNISAQRGIPRAIGGLFYFAAESISSLDGPGNNAIDPEDVRPARRLARFVNTSVRQG